MFMILWEQSLGISTLAVKYISLLNYSTSYISSQCIDDTYCERQKNNMCQSKHVTLGLGKDLGLSS